MAALHKQSPLITTGKYCAIGLYVAFALFPLYWLLKIAITEEKLIYTEGTALWPSATTLENFRTVIFYSDFMAYFQNSVIVSLGTAALTTVIASAAGYAFSRFDFRANAWSLW